MSLWNWYWNKNVFTLCVSLNDWRSYGFAHITLKALVWLLIRNQHKFENSLKTNLKVWVLLVKVSVNICLRKFKGLWALPLSPVEGLRTKNYDYFIKGWYPETLTIVMDVGKSLHDFNYWNKHQKTHIYKRETRQL